MVLSLTDDESKGSEQIWKEFGFFKDKRVDFTISKANFPENSLIYINQGSFSVVKGGEKAIYLDFVILEQIMAIANPDPKFDNYVCKDNKVIISCRVYNKSTGMYGSLPQNSALSPFEAILAKGSFHTDSIKKKVLYFFHQ